MRGNPPAPLKSSIFRTCMSKISDIINKYTVGVATLEETNAAPAELNANIRLEPGKHELTAEEIAAAKANTAAIANGYGLCLVGVPGGRRPLQSGQLYGVREPVQSLCPQPGCPDPA